jgi:hypothetical protein
VWFPFGGSASLECPSVMEDVMSTLDQVVKVLKEVAVKANVDPDGLIVRTLTEDLKKQEAKKKSAKSA